MPWNQNGLGSIIMLPGNAPILGVPLGLVIGIDYIVYSISTEMLQGYCRTMWVYLKFSFSYNIAGDFAIYWYFATSLLCAIAVDNHRK